MEPKDGPSLGDILAEAMRERGIYPKEEHTMRNIIVTLQAGRTDRKISDIKALRSATAIGVPDSYGYGTFTIGLMEAKAIIDTLHYEGTVDVEMSAERYGNFMVNRHALSDYNWTVKSSRFAEARPKIFSI